MFFHGENYECSPHMKFVSKQLGEKLTINSLATHVCGFIQFLCPVAGVARSACAVGRVRFRPGLL